MKPLIVFILGVVVGVGGYWFFTQPGAKTTVDGVREGARQSATELKQSVKEAFDPATIKEELAKTGKVIREKSRKAGEAIADATANAGITTTIKTKLLGDTGLSAFKIDVDTTDGVVTLSGTVATYEEIDRAMKLALDTEGVHKVVSTLQIKEK